jgi:uncharacterized membrane protein
VFTDVLDTFRGVPIHPLLVHATVVFVPLLILGALAYALVPRIRAKIDWAVLALAVIAPLSAVVSKLSGEALRDRLVAKGFSGQALTDIDHHSQLGTATMLLSIALGVLALLLVLLRRRPAVLSGILVVLTLAVGGATGYAVVMTGDTGAHAAWDGK